jgi:hypothetical protein
MRRKPVVCAEPSAPRVQCRVCRLSVPVAATIVLTVGHGERCGVVCYACLARLSRHPVMRGMVEGVRVQPA